MSTFKPMLGRFSDSRPEEGTVLSVRLHIESPMEKADAETRFRNLFHLIGKSVMIDHVILGHLKGTIQAGDAVFSLSMTREDVQDEMKNPAWQECVIVKDFIITVNVMSVVPVELTRSTLSAAVGRQFGSVNL